MAIENLWKEIYKAWMLAFFGALVIFGLVVGVGYLVGEIVSITKVATTCIMLGVAGMISAVLYLTSR